MRYVDGFVLSVPKKNLQAYRRMAQKAGKIWREHGALEYRECTGEGLNVKMGARFPRIIKLKPGETVVFLWIVFKSKTHRDRINAKVMKDPRLAKMMDPKAMPSSKALSTGIESADLETRINKRIQALSVALSKLQFPRNALPKWVRQDFSEDQLFWFATAMTAFYDEGI